MKTTASLKFLNLARCLAGCILLIAAWALSVGQAEAGFTVTLEQVGPNTVATGSGAIDLTGLSLGSTGGESYQSQIAPAGGTITVGPVGFVNQDLYSGLSGPTGFGSYKGDYNAISGSGNSVGIAVFQSIQLVVPQGYVSETPLSSSATYPANYSVLGLTPGTFEWTWGTGADQNFTLVIDAVPEPSVLLLICLATVLAFAAKRLRYRCKT